MRKNNTVMNCKDSVIHDKVGTYYGLRDKSKRQQGRKFRNRFTLKTDGKTLLRGSGVCIGMF